MHSKTADDTRISRGAATAWIAAVLLTGCGGTDVPGDVDAAAVVDAAPTHDAAIVDASGPPDAAPECISDDGQCPPGCGGYDLDCADCALTVPDDRPTINQAIADAPAPGTVCIRTGTYPEHVEPRYLVHLQGEGPGTVIEGNLDLRGVFTMDADPQDTAIRDLTVAVVVGGSALGLCPDTDLLCQAGIGPGRTLALLVERTLLISNADPNSFTSYCATLNGPGSLRLTVRDSLCHSDRGMRITGTVGTNAPVEYDILYERNRFEPQTGRPALNWPVELLISSTWNPNGYYEVAPLGTRVNAVLRNNEFYNSGVTGIYLTQHLRLAPQDQPNSVYDFRHNTFAVATGVAVQSNTNTVIGPPLRLANNLYWGGEYSGPAPDLDESNFEPAQDPFADLASGDLQLVEGSSPVDTGNINISVIDDFDRRPRPIDGDGDQTAEPDVGAHEFDPGIVSAR